MTNIKSNIKKYYLYQLLIGLEFFGPVIVLFWQARGLNMTQIMLLQSIYAIGVVILELPTGALADFLGKRISLILGSAFYALGFLIYGLSHNFAQFAFGELTVATGMAFVSGADKAFIHQTLKSIKKDKNYNKVEGRARGIQQVSRSIGHLLGGFIGATSLAFTLIATSISSFLSFITAHTFSKTKAEVKRKEQTEYIKIIKQSLKIVTKNSYLLWLTLFFAFFNGLVWTVNWITQPYLINLNVPIAYFGIILAFFGIVAALASSLSETFENKTKNPFFIISILAVSIMFLLGVFPKIYIFPLWAIFGATCAVNQVLISNKVLQRIPAERAATVLSFQNLVRRFTYSIFGPILGKIIDAYSVYTGLKTNAFLLLIILTILLIKKPKTSQKMGGDRPTKFVRF